MRRTRRRSFLQRAIGTPDRPRRTLTLHGCTFVIRWPPPAERVRWRNLDPTEALVTEATACLVDWRALTPHALVHGFALPLEPGGEAQLLADTAQTGGVVPFSRRTAVMLWCFTPDATLRAHVRAMIDRWDDER